jgi:hypothetical protein
MKILLNFTFKLIVSMFAIVKNRLAKLTSIDPTHIDKWIRYYIQSALDNIDNIEDEKKAIEKLASEIGDIQIILKQRFKWTYTLYTDTKQLNGIIKSNKLCIKIIAGTHDKLPLSELTEFAKQIQDLKLYYHDVLYQGSRRRLNISSLGKCAIEVYFPASNSSFTFITTPKQMITLCQLGNGKNISYNNTTDENALIRNKVVLIKDDKLILSDMWIKGKLDIRPIEEDYKIYKRQKVLDYLAHDAIKRYKKYTLDDIVKFLTGLSEYSPRITIYEIRHALDRLIKMEAIMLVEGRYSIYI